MSNYSVIDKEGNVKPVHNLSTARYLVTLGDAKYIIDRETGVRIEWNGVKFKNE